MRKKASIHFFTEDIKFKVPNKAKLKQWILSIANGEGALIDSLNYIFCSDGYLHEMNVEYLNHDTLTDVITFDNSDPDSEYIEGDIFISVDRLRENAIIHQCTFEEEFHRVVAHGLLHLIGYKDKTEEDVTKMRAAENIYLSTLS